MTDILRNPKDPIHGMGPEAEKELLRNFGQVAHGFPRETVLHAAMNLVISCIRQEHETRTRAERAFDEIAGRSKNALLEFHYDNTGKRRNVFPFTQNIDVPIVELKQKF